MSARRIALRIALRRVRRDRKRTLALTAALLVPLTLAVTLVTLRATSEIPEDVRVGTLIGQSQGVLRNLDFVAERGAERALAEGPRALADAAGRDLDVVPEVNGPLAVSSGGLQVDSFGYGLELDRPLHRGRFVLTEGRAPRAPDEVALSPSVMTRLGVRLGDKVDLGEGGAEAEVTGIAAIPTDTLRKFVVALPAVVAGQAPALPKPGQESSMAAAQDGTVVVWHTPEALTPPAQRAMTEQGWRLEPRSSAFDVARDAPDSLLPEESAAAWVLGLAVLVLGELGLVMGAVYAIVVRSSRRELALLAAAGAGPRTRRSVITHQGLLVGVLATSLAVGAGVAGAWLLKPWAAERGGELWGGLRLDAWPTAVLALLGVLTPAIAARVAARGVGGDVVAALRDQADFEDRAPRRGQVLLGVLLTCGLLLAVAGASLKAPFTVMIGALSLVIGTGVLVRRLLPSSAGRADGLRLMQRIGARLLARSASRSATMGTVVASLTVLTGLVLAAMGGLTAEVGKSYEPDSPHGSAFAYATKVPGPDTVAAMEEALGGQRLTAMAIASPPAPEGAAPDGSAWSYWGEYQAASPLPDRPSAVMVIREADLATVLGRKPTARERGALTAGGAVVLDERLAPGGRLTVTAPKSPVIDTGRTELITKSLDAVAAQRRSEYRNLPAIYIGAAGLKALGGVEQPNSAYFYLPAPDGSISAEQEDRARGALASDIGSGYFTLEVERGPVAAEVLRATTLGSAVVLMLVAATLAFLTVGLATQEMRPDLSALAAAGADRRFRSWLTGVYAGQVTLLGVLMGVGVTAVATPALLFSLDIGWSLWPWLGLAAASAGAVAAAVAAGCLGGSRVATLLRSAQ
ncbi:FtsX-like permease family protein [Streptomyces koelreuteriae]|uniref:FtsX-like permease family protein n=1 Tax=Streptomyces koelreuteriae TaxID=2838015 RepID=UPI003EB9EC33